MESSGLTINSMSRPRFLLRFIIVATCAFVGASAGIVFQALRITGMPQEFQSVARVTAEYSWADSQDIVITTFQGQRLKDSALKRVRALHPELGGPAVEILGRKTEDRAAASYDILAKSSEPRYTQVFLGAILDEYGNLQYSLKDTGKGIPAISIVERASTAVEIVPDWKLPVALGFGAGGLAGLFLGLLLTLALGRSPTPVA